jgi:hypothetical protein
MLMKQTAANVNALALFFQSLFIDADTTRFGDREKGKASKKQQNKQQLHIDSNRITAIGLRSNRI